MSATPGTQVPTIELNDGHSIPQLGFGVFQIPPPETVDAVLIALDVGYRHIDTAEMYGNEREVGEAVASSDLDRGDVFITSKLNNGFHRPEDAQRAFDGTLTALGSDYVDLFLIHWPLPTLYDGDFVSTWKVLEEFKHDGRARSITTFADKLNIPIGVLPLPSCRSALVYSIPEILRLTDTDGDGRADLVFPCERNGRLVLRVKRGLAAALTSSDTAL